MARPTRFLLPLLAAAALAACQAAPAPVAPAAFPGMAAGKGRLMVVPTYAGGPTRKLMALVEPYGEADIDHLDVRLLHPSFGGDPVANVEVPNAKLYDTIVFDNLEPGVTYTVEARAYKAPGDDPDDDITNDAAAANYTVTLAVGTDDRPTIGNLVVTLEDKPFAGVAQTTGLVVTPGGFTPPAGPGTIQKLVPLVIDRATKIAEDGDMSYAAGIARAADGTVYLADPYVGKIFVRPAGGGPIVVFAGRDLDGPSEEEPASRDGTKLTATFHEPQALALGPDGTLYVADKAAIRAIEPDGDVVTLAGHESETGLHDPDTGIGEGATEARFNRPHGLALTPAGDLIIADTSNGRLRKLGAGGQVTTIASAPSPFGVVIDRKGDYVFTSGSQYLRRCTPAGTVSLIASGLLDGHGVAMDPSGHFYVADVMAVIKISPTGAKQTLAGQYYVSLPDLTDAPIDDVRFSDTRAIAVDPATGEVYVVDAPRTDLWRLWAPVG